MTDRHGESTPKVPSVASIVYGLALLAVVTVAVVYVGFGLDTEGVVGMTMGIVLWLLLLARTYGRIIDRGSPVVDRALEQARTEPEPYYPPFVPAWNAPTSIYNRSPRYPVEFYPEAHCAPGTGDADETQVIRASGAWPPRTYRRLD
jgi:hypothetical protein